MEKNESLFIGIRDPMELRRDILECSRSAIVALKKFEEAKSLHEEKLKDIAELKLVVRELGRLSGKLRVLLPKTKITTILEEKKRIDSMIPHMPKKALHHKKAIQKQSQKDIAPQIKPEDIAPAQKSDLERLESELADIEDKLGKLS